MCSDDEQSHQRQADDRGTDEDQEPRVPAHSSTASGSSPRIVEPGGPVLVPLVHVPIIGPCWPSRTCPAIAVA